MPDLDQLRAFVVAQECGSFSAAARQLGKAQSAISTAIANLEIDLDLILFDRSGYRPELTEAGRVVLGYAKSVLESMEALEGQAEALGSQVEASITIYVEGGLFVERLRGLIAALADQFPGLELCFEERARFEVIAAVEQGRVDLALISAPEEVGAAMMRGIGFLRLVPVVHRGHSLARDGEVSRAELVKHRQILRGKTPSVSPQVWRSEGVYGRLALVKEGLGWAELPVELVAPDVLSGELKLLHYDFAQNSILETVGLVSPHSTATGPVMRWLLAEIAIWDQRAWVGDSRVGRRT